jgi:phage-related protein
MTKKTFTWFPDEGSEVTIEPAVNVTKFGDGYEIRSNVGINSQKDSWSLTFTHSNDCSDVIPSIMAFLADHGGKSSFIWESPDRVIGLYVCRSWSKKRVTPKIHSISATFERVYEEPWSLQDY